MLQQQCNKVGRVETGSVALPAIMRSGAGGPESFQMGSMPQAKQHVTSGQMHRGHMPPLVTASIPVGGGSRAIEDFSHPEFYRLIDRLFYRLIY